MIVAIKNENLSSRYPLIALAINTGAIRGINHFDKETGHEYTAIDITTMSELTSLVSMAKATNEYCTGLYFNGDTLTISEKPYTLGE